MLARHERQRFLATYPSTFGPPRQVPCAALAGPYQWLVPATTASADLPQALADLGLPAPVIQDILDSSDAGNNESRMVSRYSYAMTGQPRRRFASTGDTAWSTDTDGRSRTLLDATGARTEYQYDARGWPAAIRRFGPDGAPTGEVRWTRDHAGNPLIETVALGPGAFAVPPIADSVREAFAWTGEEQLHRHTDPVGTTTTFRYTSRKQCSGVVTASADGNQRRGIAYRYNTDGQLTAVLHGALDDNHPGIVVEQVRYDGLGRVNSTVDSRGIEWQHAWSLRDLPTRTRRSAVPYGAALPAPTIWEVRTRYDDLARPAGALTNGTELERNTWTPGGRLAQQAGAGCGTTRTVHTTLGTPAWTQTPDGTVIVAGYRQNPHRRWIATIRAKPGGQPATTTTLHELDPRGRPLTETRAGGGVEISRTWVWDDDGNLVHSEDQLGHQVDIVRNLGRLADPHAHPPR